MLGHASIVLTADTYVSVLPEVAHKAAQETAGPVLRAACKLRRSHGGRDLLKGFATGAGIVLAVPFGWAIVVGFILGIVGTLLGMDLNTP